MNLCLVTFHSAAYAALAEVTEPNKEAYAEAHGYDFRTRIFNPLQPLTVGYQRIAFVRDLLSSYDWLWFTGTDSLVTNFRIALEPVIDAQPEAELIIATDAHGLQNDSFLIRNTHHMGLFLEAILGGFERYKSAPHLEQTHMADIAPRLGSALRFVPQRTLNSYDYAHYRYLGGRYAEARDAMGNDGQWQPGDLLIHWPAIPVPVRIELANKMLGEVIK